MKNLVAFLLLIPFLGIVCHEMTPHHHEVSATLEPGAHHRHISVAFSHHQDQDHHNFPIHTHLPASGKFYAPRNDRNHLTPVRTDIHHEWTCQEFPGQSLSVPTETGTLKFRIVPYRAVDHPMPAANPLRAPPVIA